MGTKELINRKSYTMKIMISRCRLGVYKDFQIVVRRRMSHCSLLRYILVDGCGNTILDQHVPSYIEQLRNMSEQCRSLSDLSVTVNHVIILKASYQRRCASKGALVAVSLTD